MLAASNRLDRTAFTHCFKAGKRVSGAHLQIITGHSPTFKAAVVVSKKVLKKAHDRNRLRRQIYAILYNFWLVERYQKTIIVLVKPSLASLSARARVLAVRVELGVLLNQR